MYSSQTVIDNIQNLCQEKGLVLNTVLVKSGAGASLITNLRRGSMPSIEKFVLLAEFLQVPLDSIVGTDLSEEKKKELAQIDKLTQRLRSILIKEGLTNNDDLISEDEAVVFFDYFESAIRTYAKLRKK
jgi:transcriptional regulator with XRE-family HTH domain